MPEPEVEDELDVYVPSPIEDVVAAFEVAWPASDQWPAAAEAVWPYNLLRKDVWPDD